MRPAVQVPLPTAVQASRAPLTTRHVASLVHDSVVLPMAPAAVSSLRCLPTLGWLVSTSRVRRLTCQVPVSPGMHRGRPEACLSLTAGLLESW